MTPVLRRLLVLFAAVTLAIAVSGVTWEFVRFGATVEATAARLERDVRSRFVYQTRRVTSLAENVAAESARVSSAVSSVEAVPDLFARLAELSSPVGLAGTSATVYIPDASGTYLVLAWSAGPAEDLTGDRLAGPSTVFVAPGASGLRLVAVHPIESGAARIGVAEAELVLSAHAEQTTVGASACSGLLSTAFGPVLATAPCGGAGVGPAPDSGFVIEDDAGATLLEVRYEPDQLIGRRATYRRHLLVAIALPLAVLLLLLTAPALARRNHARSTGAWLGWTLLITSVVLVASVALVRLGALIGSTAVTPAVTGLTGLALASLVAGGWWWRPLRRRPFFSSPAWFVVEQLFGGLLVALTLWLLSGVLRGRISAVSIAVWQFPLFPFDVGALLYLVGILLSQIALCWTTASILGLLAERWRLSPRHAGPPFWAALLWTVPTVALVAVGPGHFGPVGAWLGAAAALAAFGALSRILRHFYRHTTQAMRMVLLFAALAAPPLVIYPLTAAAADDAARTLIETQFAPAILQQPQVVLETLRRARDEIDAVPQLESFIATAPYGDGSSAYAVWSRTSLAQLRLTSEVELFGADRQLVSRFALNVPEYPGDEVPTWGGSSCEWEVFGEVARTGAQERVMLHAERAVCDETGTVRGAVVVHAVSDYRSLPFIASGSPYADALRASGVPAEGVRLAGLEVAVYGWNDAPVFTSSGVAWPVTPEISARSVRIA